MKSVVFTFSCFVLAALSASTFAQKLEAESAALSGGAKIESNATLSGGKYVSQNEGSLSFNLSLETEGYFNIFLTGAAPSGSKINVISVDEHSADFTLAQTEYQTLKVVSSLRLSAGNHNIKIVKSWGYINIDYLELKRVNGANRFSTDTVLVTPNPNEGAVRLYNFLYDNYGEKIISGVMTLNSFDETEWIKSKTGKEPALVGLDFMHCGRNYEWYHEKQPIEDARTYYNRNGIPALCWHWRDPSRATEEFYTDKTNFDVNAIFNENSDDYKAMISDIDYISGLLKELRDENIPVIWRPLHEAAGGWFWWGAKGAEPCKKLFQVMFDRMVNHHGLNNLIWVWTREPGDDDWYPGDEYVDIVGRDIYKEGNHTSHVLEFNDLNERYEKRKMVTISECGSFPDADNLEQDGACWSWFMPWYGSFVRENKYNSIAQWTEVMNHEYVITLDEMPDLTTYVGKGAKPGHVVAIENFPQESVKIYPTVVDDQLFVESTNHVEVVILNSVGQVLYTGSKKSSTDVISFSGFASGLYFVKINRQVSKVIKR